MSYKPPILIVDDEPRMCDSLRILLGDQGYKIHTANSGKEAIEYLMKDYFDLVLLDIVMPGMNGFQVMEHIKEQGLDTAVIAITGHSSIESSVEAGRKGAYDYITKPFEPEKLLIKIKNALDFKRLENERKKAEESLREKEEQYRSFMHNFKGIVYQGDMYFTPLFFHGAVEEITGYKAEEFIEGKPRWDQVIHPDDLSIILKEAEGIRSIPNAAVDLEYRIVRKDGQTGWVHEMCQNVCDDSGNTVKFQGTILDITKHKQIEEALRESEERYREIVEGTDDLITRVDSEGRFTYVNHMAKKFFGIDPKKCIGMSAFDLIHSDDRQRTETAFAGWVHNKLHSVTFENHQVNQITGAIHEMLWAINLHYDEKGNITGINNIARDLTDRKKLEEMLLKTGKLESLGTLAGGIAHDFNNILSVILANISLAEDDIKPELGSSKFLKEAAKAAIRAKDLSARLITFSKGGKPVKKVAPIGELVTDSVNSTLSGSRIDYEFSIPVDLSPVEIDQGQMKQVIHNIAMNAQEAMTACAVAAEGRAGEGKIKVYCENITVGGKDALTIRDGKYIKISIKDQGGGIPEKNLPKIFDPYFSTKEMGTQKGMGLGLSTCHSIVAKHDGLITVESELGVGTTLALYLPASEKKIPEPEPTEEPLPERPVTGSGKILVMDDEEMIRNTARHLLSRFGYDAELSRDGAEAIELYKKAKTSGEPFDAVILDLTNQFGMGGREAIRKLLEIDPDVKAIVSTGYSHDPVVTEFWEYGFSGSLTKPYTIDELSRALSGVLSRDKKK